jgi:hypothetical protein
MTTIAIEQNSQIRRTSATFSRSETTNSYLTDRSLKSNRAVKI